MEAKKIEATLVEKTSQKGNQYKCIELQLTPNYKKVVFLENAELELLSLNTKNSDDSYSPFNI